MSWTILLLHCDQLHLHLSKNKCFWLIPIPYGQVRINSSVSFSNHASGEAIQKCVSAPTSTILPTTTNAFHDLKCFDHVIYSLQFSMYENTIKLLTNTSKICTLLHRGFSFFIALKDIKWRQKIDIAEYFPPWNNVFFQYIEILMYVSKWYPCKILYNVEKIWHIQDGVKKMVSQNYIQLLKENFYPWLRNKSHSLHGNLIWMQNNTPQ